MLGQTFAVDVNFLGPGGQLGAAESRLLEHHRAGAIRLVRTDVMDTELAEAKDPVLRGRLLDMSGELIEQHGPAVWGHSRWGSAVWGTEEDGARIDKAAAILRPQVVRAELKPNDLRDAMHVSTAARYGVDLFVTRDKRILAKAEQLHQELGAAKPMHPDDALAFVGRLLQRERIRNERV